MKPLEAQPDSYGIIYCPNCHNKTHAEDAGIHECPHCKIEFVITDRAAKQAKTNSIWHD